jgi:hypothetical protein
MIICIDGRSYSVPAELETQMLSNFQAMGLDLYRQQGDEIRFLLKPVVRWLLGKMETALKPLVGKERAAQICRPPHKGDPVVHYSLLMLHQFQALVKDATLTIETNGNCTTCFTFQLAAEGKGRGPLAAYGNVREWQDHRAQVS